MFIFIFYCVVLLPLLFIRPNCWADSSCCFGEIKHKYMKIRLFVLLFCLLFCFDMSAQDVKKIKKVACVGNSITFGAGIRNRDKDSYPAVLGQMLGDDYEVRNFGYSARTMLNKGDNPYMKEQMFRDVLGYLPDIIVVKLGTNDSKPHNWKYGKEFGRDMETMLAAFRKLASKPVVYLCTPAKVYGSGYGINDSVIVNYIIPEINRIARKEKIEVIDIHTATDGMSQNFPDNVHPNEVGAIVLAGTVYKALTGKETTHTMQAFPGRKSAWAGCDRYDFQYRGRDAIVVCPKQAAPGKPWIWRPAFFGAFPSVDKALLEKGFHVVYYDLTHQYGSPRAVEAGTFFYDYMKNYYGLSPKVTLEGFSRGGLCAFNWAAKNTDKVACIYVDAPVCDVFSWPGRKQADLWSGVLKEWNLTDAQMESFKGNPVDNLETLAKAGIPVMAVCGDSDKVVPYSENMEVVRNKYTALGGMVEVIVKPGCDHHPHSLENPQPVVDFIIRHQPGYKKFLHVNERGSLQNSWVRFEKERKGRVAFLGGSITEMAGWRTMIQQQLKQRFPYTDFEFVDAGIASTGSTPGSFRLQKDVLSKGRIDLLFVEAAVNDHTNGFSPAEQVRGMEGEVRRALLANPATDVVMLHFIYDPFIPMVKAGNVPDVIMNHERVANHYMIPSINLVQEVGERMLAGEFTWEQFGGTHPLPFGHRFYAAAIAHLFDSMWQNMPAETGVQPHKIPAEPLDQSSYFGGDFMSVKDARLGKGWKYEESWEPEIKVETRPGFVRVPMLVSDRANAKLTLDFTGKAIGIFCASGPKAAILEYSVDGSPFKKLDTNTQWSKGLYIPWVFMLASDLKDGAHKLELRISGDKNSQGNECCIRNFVVNK